ncbi:hydroxymethylglutaryl-CoA lyase [Photobacterium galatheae]|uniref:hydroxymethylglutaryl-CoA lyase n=1 Tax=Photobacterium galatheae TaxID=1654360 RepID=A0A066RVL0_9GAMM|nr:hydroxymethylglutaryl-CoA lyase [Photobacterium galatheae]KDM91702.1 hydroxymethylglutaryl-CoA lyase [Photobacterium galatheae]MCM0149813.1 hydroxymethylglutaryl-CoA lyase [Photobacterium galatheae]
MKNGLFTASASFPKQVNIVEVGPRDGLQNELSVSTADKVALVDQLSATGLRHIETSAFVSPKWVPQMADSADVFQQITRVPGVTYTALTPNLKGLELAIAAGADEIAVFASASEGFSQQNINCSIAESLKRFEPVLRIANENGIAVRGYLSCVTDCPYDGPTLPAQTAQIANALYQMGCYEISLGDTIGKATPLRFAAMLEACMNDLPLQALAVHCHNTWGQALANIYQSLLMGVSTIDASVAGLGGCPYAPGASGNVATEDVVYLCEQSGIQTGIDLDKLADVGAAICQRLGKQPNSNAALAILAARRQKQA